MEIHRRRSSLAHVRRAIERGRAVLGFLGGSITDPRPGHNWPAPVSRWFAERFPQVRIVVENAAIGATGSDLAVFRAQRDIIDRGCDICFIEYAVNDGGTEFSRRRRTQEGLIRKLLAGKGRDLVLAYTYCDAMHPFMAKGKVPVTIREMEQLGEHYAIGSVWMGLHAWKEVQAGKMSTEEWLPDGLHPQSRGSLSYAESVTAFLEKELIADPGKKGIRSGAARPEPLEPRNWEHTELLPFSEVECVGPWTVRRWALNPWIGQALCTSTVGARLRFGFEGRGLALGFDFGRTSAEFRWRLDKRPWRTEERVRPEWCGEQGWFRLSVLVDDLKDGPHRIEIEVIDGNRPDCTGTNFDLGLIGVVK